MNDLFDICERKHGGQPCSEDANKRAEPCKAENRQAVYAAVCQSGPRGLTLAEYCETAGKAKNAVSGRFSELQKLGWIEQVGDRRNGCGVWRLKFN